MILAALWSGPAGGPAGEACIGINGPTIEDLYHEHEPCTPTEVMRVETGSGKSKRLAFHRDVASEGIVASVAAAVQISPSSRFAQATKSLEPEGLPTRAFRNNSISASPGFAHRFVTGRRHHHNILNIVIDRRAIQLHNSAMNRGNAFTN
jgi:hypothetical protein